MPVNAYQEIRDPIHVFIRLDDDEMKVLDSAPVQRLRQIHQLAMSYLVYPGATHRRFEHSLGVMELAGRVFDVVTHQAHLSDSVRSEIGQQLLNHGKRLYWRKVLRMAALCHDIGHLPFSHAAEKQVLPKGWGHEQMTAKLILGDEMRGIWDSMRPPLVPMDVAKLAIGEAEMTKIAPDENYSTWESLLSEIISSDTLGVDRMDYLLRDSHHTGVAYGKFDHHRLIDTLRILPTFEGSDQPVLGITDGGIHVAEALLLARYSMFMQVYYHPTRIAYDCLLQDFLREYLPSGQIPTAADDFMGFTDNKVMEAIVNISKSAQSASKSTADGILERGHFRLLYRETLADWVTMDHRSEQEPSRLIFEAFGKGYGEDNARHITKTPRHSDLHFPVMVSGRDIVSSNAISDSLHQIPVARFGYVLVAPELAETAREWLANEKETILIASE